MIPSQVFSPLTPRVSCASAYYGLVSTALCTCPTHNNVLCHGAPRGITQSHNSCFHSSFPEPYRCYFGDSDVASSSNQFSILCSAISFDLDLALVWLLVIVFGSILPSCSADHGINALHTQNSSPNLKALPLSQLNAFVFSQLLKKYTMS